MFNIQHCLCNSPKYVGGWGYSSAHRPRYKVAPDAQARCMDEAQRRLRDPNYQRGPQYINLRIQHKTTQSLLFLLLCLYYFCRKRSIRWHASISTGRPGKHNGWRRRNSISCVPCLQWLEDTTPGLSINLRNVFNDRTIEFETDV